MGKKISFCEIPSTAGWEKYLKNLEVDASLSFQNIDNTAANARQAIKRFLKKWPGRKFSTKTCKEDHSHDSKGKIAWHRKLSNDVNANAEAKCP